MSRPSFATTVALQTVSEANRHEHWRGRQKRAKAQREAVLGALTYSTAFRRLGKHPFPLVVRLTRLAPRKLDTDNLASSQKAVRDAVAAFLEVDDGDEQRVTWSYAQEKSKSYGVNIQFFTGGTCDTATAK